MVMNCVVAVVESVTVDVSAVQIKELMPHLFTDSSPYSVDV